MSTDLKLVKPSTDFKDSYIEMVEEIKRCGEELIPWSLTLDSSNFCHFVERLDGFSKGLGLEEGYVESSSYWLLDKYDKVVGAVDIRHRLNESLSFRGGHIGYGIRPSERRKGYASVMLSLALEICRSMNMKYVLLTCSKKNTGSAKTIMNNGGLLHSEGSDNEEIFQRYWINCSISKTVKLKNGLSMIIRRPDVSDAAYMIEYLNAVGGESDNLLFGEGEFHLTVEQEKEHIRKINSEQESYMVIGIINGKLASISQISGSVRKRIAHNCELSISVRKEFWGIGAGSAILDDLISHAKESGRFKNINLGVRSGNDNAVKLYEKFGFVKSGVHKDYIRIGENFYDEILMDLNL